MLTSVLSVAAALPEGLGKPNLAALAKGLSAHASVADVWEIQGGKPGRLVADPGQVAAAGIRRWADGSAEELSAESGFSHPLVINGLAKVGGMLAHL